MNLDINDERKFAYKKEVASNDHVYGKCYLPTKMDHLTWQCHVAPLGNIKRQKQN